ncbi:MAG: alpha/beta hydrolase [Ramlibacter sp.]|nr:alpha/beta hydrolase [Ramlibacter sp.]
MPWLVGAVIVVFLLMTLTAVIPIRVPAFASHADPAQSYADAIARIARQQRSDDRVVAAGGRSVLLTHGAPTSRVVVLLHGLTNSPRQFERLAAGLHAAGDTVYIPRLPHHAERNGTAATLAGLTADELRHYADTAVDAAVALGQSIVVAGVSAGGTLVAWVVQNRADIHRAVIIAPVLEIARVPSLLAEPLMHLALRLPNLTRLLPPDPQRPDRERGVASRAVAEVLRFGASVRRAAARRPPHACEIVFVVNANDHTVKTSPVLELARCWSEHGASVAVYQFPLSLGLPHDIAEEAYANANPAMVYPALQALIHGEPPPPVLASHRLWPAT